MENPNEVYYKSQDKNAEILVVDDSPENLNILNILLEQADYTVRSALTGRMALNSANLNPPNLILLDIDMPDLDGFETCQYLKSDAITADIPIIFVSGIHDSTSKVEGLTAGAVDYITKPFDADEVLARVKTQLSIQKLQQNLLEKNRALEAAIYKQKEIEEMICHDIAGPLQYIFNLTKFIKKKGTLNEAQLKVVERNQQAGRRIYDIVQKSKNFLQLENGNYQPEFNSVNITSLITEITGIHKKVIDQQSIKWNITINGEKKDLMDSFLVNGDETLIFLILENLIGNAVEATSKNQTISISLQEGNPNLITIHNESLVPESVRSRFFEKYSTAEKKNGTGLGTYSAKLAAETQGGQISMKSSETMGTLVTVELP